MSEVDKFLDSYEAPKTSGQKPAAPAAKPASEVDLLMETAPPQDKGFLGHARDLGLSAVKSAIAVPETLVGLADIPTGGRVGKFLENEGGAIGFRPKQAKEFLGEFNTDAYKDQQRQFQEADGILDKTAVAIQNPSLIANTVVESAAPILAGGVAARGLLAGTRLGQAGAIAAERGATAAQQAQAAGRAAAAAGSIGEGTMMAGSQASAIRQETDDGLLTPTQAGAAVATGLAGTLFGYLGGRVAQRFGFGDIDTMIAQGVKPQAIAGEIARQPAKSVPRQVIEGAIAEGFLEELPQSISEQIIQNLALDKPWSEGVEDAAVMGTLAGMAMGGGASLYSGMTRPEPQDGGLPPPAAGNEPTAAPPQGFTPTSERPVIDESALGRAGIFPPAPAPIINERALEPTAPTPSQQMGLDPAAGPMSAAAALAVDSGASPVAPAATQAAAPTLAQAAQVGGMAVDPETGEILETAPVGVEQAQSDQKPTGGIADQLETIVRSGATGDALQAQVRGIMRDAEADDVLAALKDRPDLDPIAQMGLSDAAWSMLRNDLLDARGVAPEDRSIYDLAEEDAPASAVEWRFADMADALFNDDSEGWLEGADAERALGFTEEDESDAIENAAGTAGSTQADVAGAAQTGTSAIPPSTPAQAAGKGQQALGQLDVSGRTPEQLNYLATNGQPGWKEAAQAEIQRRAEPPTEAQPTQTPTAPEQSRPAPSQRSESAQQSDAIPPAASEGWDGMTAEQRAAILTKPGGWSTAKGKLNVIGKQIAGRNWSAINPTTRATIERLMQGAPDVQSAQVDAASGQGSGAVPAGSAGVAPGRPVDLGRVDQPAGAPAPSSGARVPVGTAGVQQPAGVGGRQKLAGLQAFAQQVGSNVSTEEIAALPPQEVARLYDMIVDARRLNAEVGSEWSQAAQNWIEGAVRSSIASQALGNRVADMKVRAEQFTQQSEQARVAREARKQGVQPANVPPTEQMAPQAQEAGGQEGEKAFAPETGTLGIPRADMPQVLSKSHGGLVKHLNAQGIAHETTSVDATSLKPTQAEYSPEKVEAAKTAAGDRAVIVSSDGHIVDGHHQALAAAEEGKQVKAIVLDAPIDQALEAVKNSPSAQQTATTEAAPPSQARGDVARPDEGKTGKSAAPEFTTLKDRDGNTVTVRTADLLSDRERMPMFTKDGKRKATWIHRDNLDPTGEKQAESAKEMAGNPLFNVITTKDGKAFAIKAAAQRELNARRLAETHEVVPAGDVQAGMKGYLVRKKAEAPAATHKDPGQPAKPVTQPVIAEAIQKSARNTDFNPAEAKAWILGEIDKAIAGVPERNADLSKTARQIGYVSFDVPGDGKFKVVNTVEKLRDFRAKVEKSPGFAKSPDRPMTYGSGMAGAINLDAEIRRIEGLSEADRRYQGGDVLEEIGNAIEIARLKKSKDEGKLLDRFKEASKGKDYDTWRAEQEAGEEAAARRPEQPAKRYAGPADVSSRAGQMELANRGGTIAALKAMNAQLRAIAPEEAWADANIEDAADLDALRDQISAALVRANRAGSAEQDSPLRKRLEEASGAELRAVFDALGLAGGARMIQADRVKALMSEDAQAVSDALDDVQSDGEPAAAERAMEAELDRVPGNVQSRLSIALAALRETRDRLAGVMRARGKGQILAVELRDAQGDIARRRAVLEEFRAKAGENDVDAELVIRALGGEPDFAEFGEPAAVEAPAQPPHYADLRDRARAYWAETVVPAVREYLGAFSAFGAGRLERNRAKPEGMSAREWLESFQRKESEWRDGRKVSETGVQTLSRKDLWPTEDGSGERLRKSMLAAIKALRGAPMTTSDMLAEAFMESSAAPAANQPALTGPRRNPVQVSAFAPYAAGDIVTIDGQDWQVQQDMGGWYLTSTGNWRGMHPTIQKIRGMNELIAEIEHAATAQPAAADQGGATTEAAATASDRDQFTVERVDEDQRQTLTFKRGETVKVSGKYPMETGEIDGISNARKEFRIGGAWLPFGYAYKTEYDEFAAPRRELEEMIANAEKRIADGTGFQRDGYPIREAREHAKRYGLEGYDDTLNDLAKRGQATFDRGVAEDRARMAAAEQTDRERREAADAADAAKYAGPVKMTMDEWKRIGRDFKSFNGGNRTVMQDGRIRRVEIVKEKAEAPATESTAGYAAQHEALMASVRTGKATPEAFKASFEQVVANEDAIKAELSAKTKAELLRDGGPYLEMRYANEKKDSVVDAVYRQMIGEYALGESVTYGMARDSYQKAVRRMVEATDADKLAQYVRDREAAIQEAEVRRTARAEAMANPQTLNDYRSLMNAHIREGKTRHEAFLMLTPEQRIRYDELEAEGTREAREARKRAAQNEVRAAGQTTGGQIIATKHTRDGYDLFVVQLAERLSREDYNTVLAGAKRLGGRYSAFRGNGAVPGFQFRTREDAEAFLKLAGGDVAAAKDQVEQRRDAFSDDRSQTAAERLVEMADRMEQDASAEENRDRKANTARRARFASAALNAAAAQKAMARTMRNIAQAIQEGRAKFLDAVRTRTQVEALLGYVRTAKDKELRAKYPSYADQEKRKGEPATAETAGFADFPSYTAFRSDLAMLGRQMLEIDGTKKLGQKLMSVADDVTDAYLEFARDNIRAVSQFGRGDALAEFANRESAERAIRQSGLVGKAIVLPIKRGQNRVILSPSEAMNRKVWAGDGDKRITLSGEFGKELVEAIGRRGNKTNGLAVPWQFQNAYDRRKLLSRIGIETPSEFRSALREVIALQETAVANKVREMELAMVGRRADGLDFFPTPAEIADQMVEAADIKPDMAVLEPSAGMGHIADRIRAAGAEPDVIEISAERRELLQEKGYTLSDVTDFMDLKPRAFFTFGDVFRAPDGTEGVMMGGRMGSSRVTLRPLKPDGTPDMRLGEFYDREDLTGIRHRGTESGYDRIIMNPPFSDRRDAEHVQHAYTLLRPGGRIVAIMGEGVFFGQDKRAQDFRDWLDSVGGTSEKLPEGSFMDPSLPVQTGVNARMVVIDRPAVDDGIPRPADSDSNIAFSVAAPYHRFTQGGADTGAGYMMFADAADRVERYGENHYTFDPADLPSAAVISAEDATFRAAVVRALEDSPHKLDEYQASPEALAAEINPEDIVNSAGFWDAPDLVEIVWNEVMEPNGWLAVKTQDGAIVFDESVVRQAPRDGIEFSARLPRDRNAVRIGITENGLVRAMRVQFDGLAEITGKLLERGLAGKRGGVIVVGTADNAEIGRIVAERTGRKLDSTMRKFSSAGRINGFYDPKSGLTFLVGPNLNPVTATAVMLHEMMHGQQRQKIDARALEMVRNRHSLKDEDLRAFLDRVMLRMIVAGEVGNAAEASAYIVEQAVIEGRSAGYAFADNAFMQWVDTKIGKRVGDFLRSFAGMIRTWMLRNGLGAKTMTVDDFVGYAMAGLDRAVAGEVRGDVTGGEGAKESRASQTASAAFKRLSTLLGSDSDARDMMTASSQTFVNSLKRDAEAISNFLKSKPFGSKPSGSIDIPSSVVPHVLSVTDNEQVLGAIVRSIPVDVMDFLGRKNLSPERILRDQSMLEDVLAVNGKSSVSLGINKAIAGSLMGSVADTAAEISNLASRSLKGDSAGLTGANNSVLGAQNGTPSNGLGGIKDITKSKNFLNWFGDSKVVDENGQPLVVYHGTQADFPVFDAGRLGETTSAKSAKMGFFFASNPAVASTYAFLDRWKVRRSNELKSLIKEGIDIGLVLRRKDKAKALDAIHDKERFRESLRARLKEITDRSAEIRKEQEVADKNDAAEWAALAGESGRDQKFLAERIDGGVIYPVYLAIQSPLYHDFSGGAYRDESYSSLVEKALKNGHDGLVLRNTTDSATGHAHSSPVTDIYVAFRPEQIKSAVGNNGDFDPDNDNILFSRSVGDAPAQEAQRVQSAIEGKTLIEAAQFLTRSNDGAKAAVAQKVLEKLQRLEKAGVALDLKIVHRGDMAPASMVNARGYTETGFDEKGRDIVVWLNGADVTGKVGTEEEVLLHELVHAATAGMVFYGTQTPDSLAGKHARDLMAVTDAIAEHIRRRFDAADAGKATLTEFEQDMRDGANNAFRSDDEVLAWALSSGEAQAYLETIPYRSGSMWSNFVQAVRNLLGLSARNDTALSEVLRVAERILTDDAPNAGRAAFWHKRNIRMAQQQVRGSIAQTAERGEEDLQFSRSGMRALASRATTELNNALTAPGKLSWWHKTIGTMYNLAERSPTFKPVFHAAQGFIDDVSHYAADAAERAPKLLPRLDTWRDILKSPISAEDNKAVGKPIFEGTLSWTRDAEGRPVRVDALTEAAAGMTVEEMAAELVSRGALEQRTLRMWRGMPDAQFESAIRTRYENSFLQPGIVWTDDELASMFSLTPAQIELYREFRAAVDRSLDTMARADMLRFAGEDVRFLRDPVMEADTLREAASLIVMNLSEQANAQPDRAEQFMATSQGVMDRMEKVLKLQATGYAPLSRFGKYTVDVVVDGNREYFGLFETAREANKMAERMRAEFGAGTVTQGTLSDEAFRLFAGITPESLELFGNMLGLDSTGDEAQDRAFQEYLRLTKTNRSALRRLIHRKGIAGFSEDVGRVLASFAYSNARQTAAGLHMGDLSKAVSDVPKEQGELKDVAVKLSEYIKNPQEEAQAIRGLLFAQYLGGSFASAFVNMTQPAAVTFPWLSQHGGAARAAKEITRAAKHIATRGHQYEGGLAEALKVAEEDGVVSPQEVHQLMAQARGSGAMKAGDGTRAGNAMAGAYNYGIRLSVAWGKLFSAAEQLNRRITFIAAYRVASQQRMANPAEFARRAVTETQFVYSKASKMQWGRGAVGGTLMTFKTYSVAYMELMSRLWSQGAPGSAERKSGRKAVALMLAMVLLMGGGGGLPFMEDAEDLIDGIAQIAGYNVSTKKARQQFLIDTFGADAADFIERGVSGLPGVPLDVSGRLGLGNLIPGTGIFLDRSNHTRDILELLGPVGDLGNRIVTGARKALSGDVGGAALEVSPVAVRNVAKGVDMAVMDQYRDARGRKVLDTTDLEAALKAVGFQPASVAKVQDANYLNQRAKDFYSLSADRISATWAAGIYEKDSDKVQEARDMIAQWNEDNPDQPMMIRMPNILRRVREMGKDKAQRIADTAPRAMRQQLREELMQQ